MQAAVPWGSLFECKEAFMRWLTEMMKNNGLTGECVWQAYTLFNPLTLLQTRKEREEKK